MKEIISVSRRTDMPACYLDRLIHFIKQGYAEVSSPYSGKKSIVSLKPGDVHTMVLWSKNFGNFLKKSDYFRKYNLYFLFTINDMPDLEPGIPPLPERLDQVCELAARYGAERIGWRYDPVVFTSEGTVAKAGTFERIGEMVARSGVRRVIFSFLDLYGKVKNRNEKFKMGVIDPQKHVKIDYAVRIAKSAADLGLRLESCCENLDSVEGIKPSSCINGKVLSMLKGEDAKVTKDTGQREACNCTVSRDIGSYRDMPCFNGCFYCYANPVIKEKKRTNKATFNFRGNAVTDRIV
ncbi:DUF1848 family protein [Candidatus Latescibacterota bacterium]